jgi:putative ABC transport system permease protein
MALGASPRNVLWSVARQSAVLSCAGLAIGATAASGLTRMASGLLFGIAPGDPATFVAVGIVLLGTAAAATVVPAQRAMKVDPIVTLREE